jgi:hypothetical protein
MHKSKGSGLILHKSKGSGLILHALQGTMRDAIRSNIEGRVCRPGAGFSSRISSGFTGPGVGSEPALLPRPIVCRDFCLI